MIQVITDTTGFRKLHKAIDIVRAEMGPNAKEAKEMTLGGAEIIKESIKARAPMGPTGNLKRGVVAKNFDTRGESAAFVGMDYKIAPHAHLLEYGTKFMAKRPFFRPGLDAVSNQAVGYIKLEMDKRVKRLWDKHQ